MTVALQLGKCVLFDINIHNGKFSVILLTIKCSQLLLYVGIQFLLHHIMTWIPSSLKADNVRHNFFELKLYPVERI
jgi:hypothetical protein